jgi:hypothetical protein
MIPFWKKSKVYRSKRRPNHLGAFKRWAMGNRAEFERVSARLKQKTGEEPFQLKTL